MGKDVHDTFIHSCSTYRITNIHIAMLAPIPDRRLVSQPGF